MLESFLQKLKGQFGKQKSLVWFVGLVIFLAASLLSVLAWGGMSSLQEPSPDGGTLDTPGLLLEVVLKLGIVLFLIYLSFQVFKRLQKNTVTGKNTQLSVVESVRLSPQQSLHLIRVSDFYLLIGATDHSVTKLSTVDLAPEVVESLAEEAAPQEFSALFQKMIQRREADRNG
jgi:flagellar biosynthetic protein FliO